MGWLKNLFGRKEKGFLDESYGTETYGDAESVVAVRQLAFEICVQRIAAAISKCEFRTYEHGKETKAELYYLLNVRPNPNQNATEFWNKLIHKLYYDSEALIVQPKRGCFFVADSFTVDGSELKDRIYSSVSIGNIQLKKSYKASDCFHFKLRNKRIKALLNTTLALQEGLLSSATSKYKKDNAFKMFLKLDRSRQNTPDFEKRFNQIINKDMKAFMSDKNAVMTLYDGMAMDPMQTTGKTADTRDIKALIDDTLEITSKAFLMPVNIATGEVTDTSKAVDDFLTFCLDHVVELIEDELNAKGFTAADYLAGSHIKINTQRIKHIDVLEMAGAVDKLISSGTFSINEIRAILNEEPIDEWWANIHFITKNYTPVDGYLETLSEESNAESEAQKGGEDHEDYEKSGYPDADG